MWGDCLQNEPMRSFWAIIGFVCLVVFPRIGEASLTIQFNYVNADGSFAGVGNAPTSGFFFDNSGAQAILEEAADVFEGILGNSTNTDGSSNVLDAITPGGSDTWDAKFTNPETGASEAITDLSIASGTIVIYAGGRDLGGSTLANGERGGFTSSGSQSFVDTVEARGQAGAITSGPNVASPVDDFGPWGGAVAFDSTGTTWDFVAGSATYSGSDFDFYTVALHELAHVLGFGTTPVWDTYTDNTGSTTTFDGPQAIAANGNSPVALAGDGLHLSSGLLDPTLTAGTRETLSAIDIAVMQDLWAIPEPTSITVLLPLLFSAFFFRNRRKLATS